MVGKAYMKGGDPWDPELLTDPSEDEIEARHSQRGMNHIGVGLNEVASKAITGRRVMDHPWLSLVEIWEGEITGCRITERPVGLLVAEV